MSGKKETVFSQTPKENVKSRTQPEDDAGKGKRTQTGTGKTSVWPGTPEPGGQGGPEPPQAFLCQGSAPPTSCLIDIFLRNLRSPSFYKFGSITDVRVANFALIILAKRDSCSHGLPNRHADTGLRGCNLRWGKKKRELFSRLPRPAVSDVSCAGLQ